MTQRQELSAAEARRLSYYFLEGTKQKLAGNLSAAHDLFQYCLDIDPTSSEALYEMGIMKFMLHQDSLGTVMIRKASELAPQNPWYMETLAAAYLNTSDSEKAIPVLERLSQIQTKRTDVLSQLVDLYKADGNTKDAISALNRIEVLEGKSVQTSIQKYALYLSQLKKKAAFAELHSLEEEYPHDLRIPIIIGKEYLQNGEEQKALECYERVRKADPSNSALQLAMIDYYAHKKQYERRDALRDSLLFAPGTAGDLRLSLVSSLVEDLKGKSNQQEQIMQTLDSLITLSPTADMYAMRSAYLMYAQAGQDTIVRSLRDLLEIDPSSEMALSRLLPHYLQEQDFDNAVEICRMGINSYPENLVYHYYLGISLYQQKQVDAAIEAFQNGLHQVTESSQPDMVSDLYTLLGDCYHEQNRVSESYAAYDSCLVYKPDNAACLNNYAYYLSLENEQLDKAEQMSYRAIKLEPLNKTYLDTYAWILYCQGNFTMAKFYIDRVVPPSADDETLLTSEELHAEVIQHAADIYKATGQTEQAERYQRLAQQKTDTEKTNEKETK